MAPSSARPDLSLRSPRIRLLLARLAASDLAAIAWAVFGAQLVRFGGSDREQLAAQSEHLKLSYTTTSLVLIVIWWLALVVHGGYDVRLFGHGGGEYRRIIKGTMRAFALVAMTAYALQVQLARGYILLALPAGLVALLVSRRLWRRWLAARRSVGELTHRVLVVGDEVHSRALVEQLRGVPEAGYSVVAVACSTRQATVAGVPVIGEEGAAAQLAQSRGITAVAATSSSRLGPDGLRHLGWALEGSGIELVVAPALTDVAGPRVLTRPVAGLALLHVEAPTFSGPRLVLKTAVDWVGALLLVIALAPVLLVVALVVKLHDRGPVLFVQQRVGLHGREFGMLKFRSMVPGAEGMDAGDEDDGVDRGPLFKRTADPRVTRVGSVLRRYSLDELPQLLNVLGGQMSLVGPRPPLPQEVSQYEADVHRRLLVKPGMTGLWQINGRSNLSWEESVRFDLYYVENWSVAQDLLILWRTAAAVLRKDGAY